MELDHLVDNLPSWIENSRKLFLVGESEGGMVASRYSHPKLDVLLKSGGRVVLQWAASGATSSVAPTTRM
jgi:carboxypeptidase C (cathepsin A)